MRRIAEIYDALVEDEWRKVTPFSKDIAAVNELLWHPYVTHKQQSDALSLWLQGNQPCLFGRIAAKRRQIAICVLTERDLLESDEHIAERIREARLTWKRRALRGQQLHGFMLVVASRRVALARPDVSLRAFSLAIRDLAGWPHRQDIAGNEVSDETLYLESEPGKFVRFIFSVDFFAAAGDRRWWHDHRVPGGVAFTANSLGHMMICGDVAAESRTEWALRTAMLTIARAATTEYGAATQLMEKRGEQTLKEFKWSEKTDPPDLERLKNSDFTSYTGFLHTDHAVRNEFFDSGPEPPMIETPYAMDFTYIFDASQADHSKFIAGEPVSKREVEDDLGAPNDWRFITEDVQEPIAPLQNRISDLLAAFGAWELSDEEVARLTS